MKAQVHRFHGKVAIYVGNGDTVYLSPDDAEIIAQALDDCAHDCRERCFTESEFSTREVDIGRGMP